MTGMYKPLIVRAKVKDEVGTPEEYRERYRAAGATDEELRYLRETDKQLAGLELILSKWNYDGGMNWHLHGWQDKDDQRVKDAMYYAEQILGGEYYNNYDAFSKDWDKGNYAPDLIYTLEDRRVQVLEVIQEEENNIPPDTVKHAVALAEQQKEAQRRKDRSRRRQTKKKYRGRR